MLGPTFTGSSPPLGTRDAGSTSLCPKPVIVAYMILGFTCLSINDLSTKIYEEHRAKRPCEEPCKSLILLTFKCFMYYSNNHSNRK